MHLTRHPAAIVAMLALVAGVLAAAAGCAATPQRNAAPPAAASTRSHAATAVRRVSPVNAKGHLRKPYTVTATSRGYCWTTSFVNGRLYRCMGGNNILDPCWRMHGGHSVACLPRPWSPHVVKLRLTKRLPRQGNFPPSLWGLRIGDAVNVNCLVSMGASGEVGNHPISYICRRGWVLVGTGPDRKEKLWTMLSAKSAGNHYRLQGRKHLTAAWKAVALGAKKPQGAHSA